MKKTRTKHNPAFKAKVALAHCETRSRWPRLRAATRSTPTWSTSGSGCCWTTRPVVRDGPGDGGASDREDVLLKKIGELTSMEHDFCHRARAIRHDAATSPDCAERHAVDAAAVRAAGRHPIEHVLRTGGPGRGGTGGDHSRRIDGLHLKHPFFGSRMITQTFRAEGALINRKRVQRLMP